MYHKTASNLSRPSERMHRLKAADITHRLPKVFEGPTHSAENMIRIATIKSTVAKCFQPQDATGINCSKSLNDP